jgi:hypothetical protein
MFSQTDVIDKMFNSFYSSTTCQLHNDFHQKIKMSVFAFL